MPPPVVTQDFQQRGRHRHAAVLVALAVADPQQHAAAVDVCHLQRQHFGGTQTAGIGGLQHEPLDRLGEAGEQPRDLVAAEHGGVGVWHLVVWVYVTRGSYVLWGAGKLKPAADRTRMSIIILSTQVWGKVNIT